MTASLQEVVRSEHRCDADAASADGSQLSPEPAECEDYSDDDDDDAFYYDDQTDLLQSTSLSSSTKASHAVLNAASAAQKMETKRTLCQGRDDRATMEQVLDPRTRHMLFKLLSRGWLEVLEGCLSTGKEANVYYAKAGPAAASQIKEFAIKIYKTSILVFKDRDKYVAGEHRWRKGYCKSNPRKMVQVWAEKELRNYKRIHRAGIPTPQPLLLKSHILVMEFLGQGGWPSPRLKDAILSTSRLREAYVQCVLILRHLFQKCRLVHGDLSEYNLLWHDNRVYVIDVSQSVETDHPSALDFLRKDIANVNDYFAKSAARLSVMTTRQLFDYITDDDLAEKDELERLDEIMKDVDERETKLLECNDEERRQTRHAEAVQEAVFMSSFLPRSLNQVADHEMELIQQQRTGDVVGESYRAAVASMTVQRTPAVTFEEEKSPAAVPEDEGSQQDGAGDSDDDESCPRTHYSDEETALTPEEVKAQRKANKKAVKAAQSEKRRNKLKKKDKKRAIKKSKAGNRKNK